MSVDYKQKGKRLFLSVPEKIRLDMERFADAHYEGNVSLMLRMLFADWRKKVEKKSQKG
jgi:hypothetical protein